MLHKRLPYGLVTTLMIVTVVVILALLLVAGPEEAHATGRDNEKHSAILDKVSELENVSMRKREGSGVATATSVDSNSKATERSKQEQLGVGVPIANPTNNVPTGSSSGWRARSGDVLKPAVIAVRPTEGMLKQVVELTIDRAAKVMVAILVVAFSALWWKMMKHDLRTWLVRVLGRRIVNRYMKRGDFDDDDVRDLVALGAHAAGGHEKGKVINTLREVCGTLLRSSRYAGTELGALVYGFRAIYRLQRSGAMMII